MVEEILEAIIKATLPLGVFSYLLFHWSFKSGRLGGAKDRKGFKAEMKALKQSGKNKKTKSRNPVHNKWMKFGGGFYGLVGLWTFLVVEVLEVYDFATGYEGMDSFSATIANSSFVDLGIGFIINSIKNFVTAIAWPGYWPDVLDSQQIWVWLIMAYAGYWIGMKLARKQMDYVETPEE